MSRTKVTVRDATKGGGDDLDCDLTMCPMLVSFASGPPTSNLLIDANGKPGAMTFKVLADKDSRYASRRIIVADTPKIQLRGRNYGVETAALDISSKYLVGIYDKTSQVLKIADVGRVIKLHRFIKDPSGSLIPPDQEYTNEESRGAQAQARLVSVFGSKKRKQELTKIQDNTITDANVVAGTALSSIMTERGKILVEDVSGHLHRPHLPPYNSTSVTATEIYNVDDIASATELKLLSEHKLMRLFNDCISETSNRKLNQLKTKYKMEKIPLFVVNCLESGFNNNDVALLVYLTLLVRFNSLPSKFAAESGNVANIEAPLPILESFINRFTEGDDTGNRVRSDVSRNKLLSYTLILMLFCSKFELNVNAIHEDLRLRPKELERHCADVGCGPVVRDKVRWMALKVPLKFPEPLRKRQKR